MADLRLTLEDEGIYHIYNNAVGKEKLFYHEFHYLRFLEKLGIYLAPLADIWCYSLLPDKYHILIEIKKNFNGTEISKAISKCCNAHAKWINKLACRKGNLFNRPFKRYKIWTDRDVSAAIWFIHNIPKLSGEVKNFHEWRYSSYHDLLSGKHILISEKAIDHCGNVNDFISFHQNQPEEYYITADQPVRFTNLTG